MGALGCGSTCIKYLLFFFNFLFALGGLALAILGGMSLYNMKHLNDLPASVNTYPGILLAAGIVIFVVAFYGCCGAVRESHCMLITFAVLLLTLVVLEVAVASAIFVNKDQVQDEVQKGLYKVFDQADRGDQASIATREVIQKAFRCCGRDSAIQIGLGGSLGSLPASCCDSPPCNTINAYHKGCIPAFKDYVKTHSDYLAYIAIAVAVVEILEVIFALGLASSIKRSDRRY